MSDPAMPELIIYRPQLEPPARRYLSRALTLVAWSMYFYLWLPLVTLAAWWLSLRFGVDRLRIADTPPTIDRALFVMLGLVAMSAVVVFIGWAEYNRLRYGRRERRRAAPPVTLDESASALGVAPELAAQLRGMRVATVALDDRAAAIGIAPTDRKPMPVAAASPAMSTSAAGPIML